MKKSKKILIKDAKLLPLKNFVQIIETNNLKYLQPYEIEEPPELTDNEKKEAEIFWQNILSQIKDLDVQLPVLYFTFLLEGKRFELDYTKQRLAELKNKLGKKNNIPKLKTFRTEKAFKEYIDYLDAHYSDFEIDEVRPIDDFRQNFEKIIGIKDKEVEKLFEIKAWYILDEYKHFVTQNIPTKYHQILLSKDFLATFFKLHRIKIGSLNTISNYLAEIYKEQDKYYDWLIIRTSYFDLDNLVFNLKNSTKKIDIFDEIVRIEHITNVHIDFETDSLAKYIAQRQLANEIVEQQNKNHK